MHKNAFGDRTPSEPSGEGKRAQRKDRGREEGPGERWGREVEAEPRTPIAKAAYIL